MADVLAYAPIMGCALSADGRYVAVIVPRYDARAGTRLPLLWVADLDGSQTWQPAGQPGDTFHSPVFSCDGQLLVFRTHGDVSDATILDPTHPAGEGRTLARLPPAPVSLGWWGAAPAPACIGLDGAGVRRVWVWDAWDQPPRVASPAKLRVGDVAFAPGAEAMAFLHSPLRKLGQDEPDTTLYWTPTLRKKARPLSLPVPMRGFLVWSPDGQWLAGLARAADHTLTAPTAWVVHPRTGECRQLLRGVDGHITALDWCPDSSGLIVSVERGVDGTMWRASLDGQAVQFGPAGTFVNGARQDAGRGRVLHLKQDGDDPQHVRLIEPGATASKRITAFHPRLRQAALRPYERVTWEASDGCALEGLLALPEAPCPPVVVWLHGGPAEHLQRTFSAYFQLLLAQGWAVFAPNYRGSTGRSDAFVQALVGGVGVVDVADVVSGLEALGERVDTSRAAMVGWSFGGTLALDVAMAWPGTRAVVAGAPVVDWLSVFGAVSWPSLTRRFFEADPWSQPEVFDAASVVRRLGGLRAPTLLLHGELDDRVPVAQSRLAYRLLQARGVQTDLRLFPGEGHVFGAPWAIREMLARMVAWLGAHLDAPGG